MIKEVVNGAIKINKLSFLEFSRVFSGFHIARKSNGAFVPKWMLFWSGYSVLSIKKNFDLIERKNDD